MNSLVDSLLQLMDTFSAKKWIDGLIEECITTSSYGAGAQLPAAMDNQRRHSFDVEQVCVCLYIYACMLLMYAYAHTCIFLYTYVYMCVYAQGYCDSDDDSASIGAISVATTYLDILSTSGSINGDMGESVPSVQSPKKQQSTKKIRSPNYRGMYAYLASLIHAQIQEEMDREKNLLSIDIQESKDKVLSSLMTAFVVEG